VDRRPPIRERWTFTSATGARWFVKRSASYRATQTLRISCKGSSSISGKKGETPEFPYLCRAITNRSLTFLRDERNRARILDGNDAVLRGPVRTRCDERTLDMDLLVKLISSVDEQTLEIIVLRFFDDMTQEEISSMVGLSRKTVGKKLDAVHEIVARMSSDTLDPSGGTS
jgi:RNA polymerase sigma factor (sigma-70 family)